MDLLAKLKAVADKNGDGKITIEDLQAFQKESPEMVQKLTKMADQNGDGKVDLADIQKLTGTDATKDLLGGLGDKLGGMFGGKKS